MDLTKLSFSDRVATIREIFDYANITGVSKKDIEKRFGMCRATVDNLLSGVYHREAILSAGVHYKGRAVGGPRSVYFLSVCEIETAAFAVNSSCCVEDAKEKNCYDIIREPREYCWMNRVIESLWRLKTDKRSILQDGT